MVLCSLAMHMTFAESSMIGWFLVFMVVCALTMFQSSLPISLILYLTIWSVTKTLLSFSLSGHIFSHIHLIVCLVYMVFGTNTLSQVIFITAIKNFDTLLITLHRYQERTTLLSCFPGPIKVIWCIVKSALAMAQIIFKQTIELYLAL